ncbi:MAG TPA: hypothetical protein VGP26_26210 [Actinophytocola sp.]|nr:hypothetical protein [Actinophytocola sp.]
MHVRTFVRALATATTLVTVTAVTITPATAAPREHWALTLLPLPAGHEDAKAWVDGTDGHGGYAGEISIGARSQVVTWAGDRPALRGAPAGADLVSVRDENASGTVVGHAMDADAGMFEAFLLDGAGFRVLPSPPVFRAALPSAINDRGDVVGTGANPDGSPVPVLWPAGDLDHPVVVGPDLFVASADDIDDAGTILLNDGAGAGYLWLDGALTPLPSPPGHTAASAASFSSTLVVGSAQSTTRPGADGVVWCRPDNPTTCGSGQPQVLPGGGSALFVGESGLVVGRERSDDVQGPLAVWNGLEYVERLEVPEGRSGSAGAIGADGAVVGYVTAGAPDEGGQPAVWRPVGS